MTVTVERMIQWLKTQPQDAILEVATVEGYTGSGDPIVGFNELQASDLKEEAGMVEIMDLRGNPFVTPDKPYYGKVFIRLGNIS